MIKAARRFGKAQAQDRYLFRAPKYALCRIGNAASHFEIGGRNAWQAHGTDDLGGSRPPQRFISRHSLSRLKQFPRKVQYRV